MRQAAREAQVRVDVLLEDEADAGGHQERQPHRDSEGEDIAEGNTHGAPPQLCGEYRLAKPERPLQQADEAEGAYGPDGGHHPTEQVMASPLQKAPVPMDHPQAPQRPYPEGEGQQTVCHLNCGKGDDRREGAEEEVRPQGPRQAHGAVSRGRKRSGADDQSKTATARRAGGDSARDPTGRNREATRAPPSHSASPAGGRPDRSRGPWLARPG